VLEKKINKLKKKNMNNLNDHSDSGHDKEYLIIVNGREKSFAGKEITFKQVVELALGTFEENPDVVYTVSYSKGEDKKEGTMTVGTSVKVKNGMIFNVTRTNRS
jgi:hypothetical protein